MSILRACLAGIALLFVLIDAPIVNAQSLQFEVASVKPDHSPNGVSGDCHGANSVFAPGSIGAAIPRGRCIINAARLTHLMMIAYGVGTNLISGGPDWIGPERFNIEGKAENPAATHEQLIQMLQALLADRFKLKFHRVSKDIPGYALVIAKNGPKLKEAKPDQESSLTMRGGDINKFDRADGTHLATNTIAGHKLSMAQFANALGLPAAGPVVDETMLPGLFDFEVTWEPGESLSGVLQEQLGLRLESKKVLQESFVIDSAEKPTEN